MSFGYWILSYIIYELGGDTSVCWKSYRLPSSYPCLLSLVQYFNLLLGSTILLQQAPLLSSSHCLADLQDLALDQIPAINGIMAGVKNFNPDRDIPSLEGKVIYITGGSYSTFPILNQVS